MFIGEHVFGLRTNTQPAAQVQLARLTYVHMLTPSTGFNLGHGLSCPRHAKFKSSLCNSKSVMLKQKPKLQRGSANMPVTSNPEASKPQRTPSRNNVDPAQA